MGNPDTHGRLAAFVLVDADQPRDALHVGRRKTGSDDLGNNLFRSRLIGSIVDDDRRALGRELFGYAGTDAF